MEKIQNISSKVMRYNASISLIEVIGIALLAQEFIMLYYGNNYAGAVAPLLMLLPGVLGFALARPLIAIGQGSGQIGLMVKLTFVPALLNVILNVVLVPRYGIIGAGFATSITYGCMFVSHLYGARRLGYNPLSDMRLPGILTSMVIALLPGLWIEVALESNLLSLVTTPIVVGVLYLGLLIHFNVISQGDLVRLRNMAN
jgi:O-antigen/teichoic acid export membrane protein